MEDDTMSFQADAGEADNVYGGATVSSIKPLWAVKNDDLLVCIGCEDGGIKLFYNLRHFVNISKVRCQACCERHHILIPCVGVGVVDKVVPPVAEGWDGCDGWFSTANNCCLYYCLLLVHFSDLETRSCGCLHCQILLAIIIGKNWFLSISQVIGNFGKGGRGEDIQRAPFLGSPPNSFQTYGYEAHMGKTTQTR